MTKKIYGHDYLGNIIVNRGKIIGLDLNNYPIYEREPTHVMIKNKLIPILDLTCSNEWSIMKFRKQYKDKL